MSCYLGLDLGGTNIKVGLVDDQARLLAHASTPTPRDHGAQGVAEHMAQAGRDLVKQAGLTMERIKAIGIGSPGPLDSQRGIVIDAPNLPGFENIPLAGMVASLIGRPTVLENDANAAAFGEFKVGAGKDTTIRHLVMLTLGTGVGGGVICDGKLVRGVNGLAGEVGHMIVEPRGRACGCGQEGCLEAYASASSTARRAAEAAEQQPVSRLAKNFTGRLNQMTSKDVFEAAGQGDELALTIVDQTAYYLGVGCVNLCRLLDPQMVVFAGGMIEAGDMLFTRIRDWFDKLTWDSAQDQVVLAPAELGTHAGVIGAACCAIDAEEHQRLIQP